MRSKRPPRDVRLRRRVQTIFVDKNPDHLCRAGPARISLASAGLSIRRETILASATESPVGWESAGSPAVDHVRDRAGRTSDHRHAGRQALDKADFDGPRATDRAPRRPMQQRSLSSSVTSAANAGCNPGKPAWPLVAARRGSGRRHADQLGPRAAAIRSWAALRRRCGSPCAKPGGHGRGSGVAGRAVPTLLTDTPADVRASRSTATPTTVSLNELEPDVRPEHGPWHTPGMS